MSVRFDPILGKVRDYSLSTSSAATVASAKKPVDSTVCYFGDSLEAYTWTNDGINQSFNNYGFATFAQIYSNSALYCPIGYNKGVAGETSVNMLARLKTAVDLRAKVVIVGGTTNDMGNSIPLATTLSNLRTFYDAFLASGAIVIATTISQRTGAWVLTAPNEANRVATNTWIKQQASDRLKVVDSDTLLGSTAAYFRDGLHYTALGASVVGSAVASVYATIIDTQSKVSALAMGTAYNNNPNMTGTGGTKNTATGSVVDLYDLTSAGAGGATVVGSKTTDENRQQQVITLSGNYTGSNKKVELASDYVSAGLLNGDLVEGVIEFEVLTVPTNIIAFNLCIQIFTTAYAVMLTNLNSYYQEDLTTIPLAVGRYVMRTPTIVLTSNGAIVSSMVQIHLKNAGVSTPVSGSFKIHKVGLRKL